MAEDISALEHLGAYEKNPAFSAFHQLSEKAFATFHKFIASADPKPRTELIRRMVYVAEATSAALRLTASWALTHPAFSLCRDRYEQCVRFSWLARQTDDLEWHRYVGDLYFRRNHLNQAFKSRGLEVSSLDDGFEELPPEKKKSFRHWNNLKLDQMAERRDILAGITETRIDGETLRTLYDSIYRQGSSVSHYDLYSIQMLGVYEGPKGLVLAPDPAMPIVTVLHCALFDLIQCAEALAKVERPPAKDLWNSALDDWWALVKRMGILEVGT